jgi:hypothetical protein
MLIVYDPGQSTESFQSLLILIFSILSSRRNGASLKSASINLLLDQVHFFSQEFPIFAKTGPGIFHSSNSTNLFFVVRVADPDLQLSVKSWIRIRIGMKVKVQKLSRYRIEPWRAVYAHNGDLEAQNGELEGLYTRACRFFITLMRSRIWIRIQVKSWIRIRIRRSATLVVKIANGHSYF